MKTIKKNQNPFEIYFIFKFIFSMNILTLFFNNFVYKFILFKKRKKIYLLYSTFLFYFILDIILVPGGRINILIALIFIIFQYLNSKFNIKTL